MVGEQLVAVLGMTSAAACATWGWAGNVAHASEITSSRDVDQRPVDGADRRAARGAVPDRADAGRMRVPLPCRLSTTPSDRSVS